MGYFGIRVVDSKTGRGVPLVELETTNRLLFVTDSAGWAAIDTPSLMDKNVFFHIRSHGYSVKKDGFGYAGARLDVRSGGRAIVKIDRVNLAERVCRLTGEGIYADSVLLGEKTPLKDPLLPGGVVGQDSAQATVFRGKWLWFWGDTSRAGYPLGNFRTTGAVASLPTGKRDADSGLDFDYFTGRDGFVRPMFPTDAPGPVWISGLATVGDGDRATLLTYFMRMKDLGTKLEQGFLEWDDRKREFVKVANLPLTETWRFLDGHPTLWTDGGRMFLAGGFCFPNVRVPATRDAVLDPARYEAFTCLDAGGKVVRDASGGPVYAWRTDASPIDPAREAKLVDSGELRESDARFLPKDADGKRVICHGGAVSWSAFRKKWILIATRSGGKDSLLGELVYSEADSPVGPWKRAVTILTHEKYTFYNPVRHAFLDTDGGRTICFEGTYTAEFSGNPRPTPRYDYNQILYKLDLTTASRPVG